MLKLSYGLQIEDTFTQYLDFSISHDGFFKIKKSSKAKTVSAMYQDLQQQSCYKDLSRLLYAYFKTYSQYEHFSLMGHGDSLTPFDEDSPMFSKPYEYIAESVKYIARSAVDDNQVIISFMNPFEENLKKIKDK